MFAFASSPLPIHKVIAEGFKLFSATFSKIWYWSFLFYLINSTPNIIMALQPPAKNTPPTTGYLLLYLVTFFIQIYGVIFLTHRIYALGMSFKTPIGLSFNAAKEKFLSTTLAFSILIFGFLSVIFFFITPLFKLNIYLGLFITIPLFTLGSVLFLFFCPLIIFAGESAMHSLIKSTQLARGHYWETLLVPLAPLLISLLLSAFAALIQAGNSIGLNLSLVVISSFIAPLTYSLILVQYNNLRLIQNQTGLLNTP